MTKEQKSIKLESIRYCLTGLIEDRAFNSKSLKLLKWFKAVIDRLAGE